VNRCPEGSCSPWRAHTGVGSWSCRGCGEEPMLQQIYPEGMQAMGRTHAGAVHEGHWGRGRA